MKNLQRFLKLFMAIVICLSISGYLAEAEVSGPRILSFSGYNWIVKSGEIPLGPGPNYFSDSSENVWVDELDQLHLKITKRDGRWYCAEVGSQESLGYGKYIFYLASRVDELNEHVVLGLFTWDYAPEYSNREIDIEFSRWGEIVDDNAQYVVQPWRHSGNRHRFNIQLKTDNSTHSFNWKKDNIYFESLRGHHRATPDDSYIIQSLNYTLEDIPAPGNEKARINLWLFRSEPPSDNMEAEVIIKKFEFIPLK